MNISLQGKKALVGGCTQGLGKAIALQLASSGASVTLMSRNPSKLQQVLAELDTSCGQQHQLLEVDFSQLDHFKTKIDNYFEQHAIDILINNSQGPATGTPLEKNHVDYQEAFDLLFQTHVYVTTKALKYMRANKFGRIVNVASVSVKDPIEHLVLSNCLRSALVSWAKTLSNQVAKDNITVNSILTGYFDTERVQQLVQELSITNKSSEAEVVANLIQDIPAQRFGKPQEYGYLVAFLCSDLAAYITGTTIPIDGGRTNII